MVQGVKGGGLQRRVAAPACMPPTSMQVMEASVLRPDRPLQVACFCGTSMAAESIVAVGLPLGRSLQESEMLLQQTEEARRAGLRCVPASHTGQAGTRLAVNLEPPRRRWLVVAHAT